MPGQGPFRPTSFGPKHAAFAVVLVFGLGSVACEPSTTVDSAMSPEATIVAVQPSTSRRLNYDDRLAALADTFPGFAGFFYEDGQLVARVRPGTSTDAAVREALGRFMSRQASRNPEVVAIRRAEAAQASIRSADYDFRQLHTWYRNLRGELFSRGWVGRAGIDERSNRIVVGITQEANLPEAASVVASLDIPSDAVVLKHRPSNARLHAYLSAAVDPRVGGVQITRDNQFLCSLGFSVNWSADSNWYFATAGHCTDTLAVLNGDTLGQPTLGSRIGYEVAENGQYTESGLCNGAPNVCSDGDIALLRYTIASKDFMFGHIAWPSNIGDTTFTSLKRVGQAWSPSQGQEVTLVGRSSGRIEGEVIDTCDDVEFSAADIVFVCVWVTDYDSADGDSGAPVVGYVSSYTYWTGFGVHFGGQDIPSVEGYFNGHDQWTQLMIDELGSGSLCINDECAPYPVVEISGPSTMPSGLYCTWEASAENGIGPPYTYSWSGVASGSGSDVQAVVNSSGWLTVQVWDDVGHTDTDQWYITIDEGAEQPPECQEEQQ